MSAFDKRIDDYAFAFDVGRTRAHVAVDTLPCSRCFQYTLFAFESYREPLKRRWLLGRKSESNKPASGAHLSLKRS